MTIALFGCQESAQPPAAPAPPADPEEVIRQIIADSDEKLEAALAEEDVSTTASQIVSALDDYEDHGAMHQFEEFHRGIQDLAGMAHQGASQEELQAKISELKQLADELLAESREIEPASEQE
ncbi:hypothetical protein [Maioricimonas rarisocia]|nr:hypothetical protein [Maioricimonas rarisocia]